MPDTITKRLRHAWNAFRSRDPTTNQKLGSGSSAYYRPDRLRMFITNERSTIISIYNRIALDVAALTMQHVRLDQNGRYVATIDSDLNYALTEEANIDQTGRALIKDTVMSMFDEGVVAVVPVDTTDDPTDTSAFDVETFRTGRIVQWFPQHVRVRLYNEQTGKQEEITLPKKSVAIIENPFYAVMNEPNSTLKRLLNKLSILDAIDEQSGAGKLDLIIQLPYVIKTEARKAQAEERRKDIEFQLSGSKYGIAYTDGTEKITQLNRPAENNLMNQIQYLTNMLYSQLGSSEDVFTGKASEEAMLNYQIRTVGVIATAIVEEFRRKFLSKTARTQKQSIVFFKDSFSLVPATKLADIADKFTRNEILSPNEIRSMLGYKPDSNPKSDELRNPNMPATAETDSGSFEQDSAMNEILDGLEQDIDAALNDDEDDDDEQLE